ncbi:Trp biosynthesis-associated membrane protein [Ornithinicoccus hortensis]|uniref:Putative membrane protein (TIGR02234 family) n=1 Tax=Ornithinicoccus hortensis TaxID=82346 RepID=A0A542YSK6_9MICO|nr:Trp biosynthesis-associated membrane protein [Ornithinicoccus hortensis]TQL51058.1 putative membrane protein (TIGR02234 family) [Ornithinicoccus hortensis]
MRSRLVARGWFLAALLGVLVLLIGSARPWVHARSEDAVVGAASLTVTGSELSPAVPAAALLAGAAVLAGLVGSAVVRRLAGVCLVLAAVVAGVPVLGLLRDPAAAAGPVLAERTAITGAAEGTRQVQAEVTWVVYAALLAVLCLAVAGLLRLLPVAAGQRPGTVVGGGGPSGDGGENRPVADHGDTPRDGYGSAAWEQLSAGEDPTADGPAGEAGDGPGEQAPPRG